MNAPAKIDTTLKLPLNRGCYYGGAWHAPKSGREADSINPGTGESLGKAADGGAADAAAAVAAAKAAFRDWRNVLPLERAKMLRRIAEVLRKHVFIDTTLLHPALIRASVDLLGADNVVAGSDWPITFRFSGA